MTVRTSLYKIARAVSDEADRNPEFAEKLQSILKPNVRDRRREVRSKRSIRGGGARRPANRRPAALLDPIALAQKGEDVLRTALEPLTLDQLKDIVADYGMDQKKLVMKWKTSSRVIERIVEISISRAHKGEAFRS